MKVSARSNFCSIPECEVAQVIREFLRFRNGLITSQDRDDRNATLQGACDLEPNRIRIVFESTSPFAIPYVQP